MDLLFNNIYSKIKLNNISILNNDILKLLATYSSLDYQNYVKLNNNNYNKIIVKENELLKLYVITWMKNQHTNIHNHPNGGCIMKVIHGQLTEIKYNKLKTISHTNLIKSNQTNIITNYNSLPYHQIINNFSPFSVSLHLYKSF
jgi:hypothetical protein